MSLDDPTPTEYFGPHAKRWTNPDTGVTISLSPRDYYRALAKEQLRREEEVKARIQEKEQVRASWDKQFTPAADPQRWGSDGIPEEGQEVYILQGVNAGKTGVVVERRHGQVFVQCSAPEGGVGWYSGNELKQQPDPDGTPQPKPLASTDGIISMDTMYDRDLEPHASWFKEKGVLVTGEVDSDFAERLSGGTLCQPEDVPDPVSLAIAEKYGVEAVTHRDYALAAADDVPDPAQLHWFGEDSAQTHPPVSHTLPAPARLAHVTLADADDTIGRIQLMTDRQAGEAPAARHLRRRRISRNAARLVLVYIIAVIGVAAVMGVIS